MRTILLLLATVSVAMAQAPRPPVDKLSRLTDVSITSASDAQVLSFNSVSGKWENAANAGGALTLTGDTTGTKVGSSLATTTSNMTAPASFTMSDSGTNAIHAIGTFKYDSTGTPGIGFGMKNIFELETTTTNDQIAAVQIYRWSTATNATRTSQYTLQLSSLGTVGDVLVIEGNGNAVFTGAVTGSNLNISNWDTAYSDRLKWDGGSTGLTAATGRTSLGLVIGTNVEAWDTDLDTWATKTPYAGTLTITTGKTFNTTASLTLTGTDGSTLNIGTGGTLGSNAFTSTAYVPTSTTVNGHALSSNVTVTPTDLSLVIGTNTEAWDADLDIWATLTPSANFQTMSAHTFSQMRTDLSLVIGTNVQAWDADLDTLAGLTATTDNFIVSVSSLWASRTPAQVRTTLGLVIGTNVEAWDADLDTWASLTPSANFQTMVPHTFSQMRTDLSLVVGTNVEAWDADLDTWATLTPSANFQTMAPHTFSQMRSDLSLVIGTNVEAWDADLDTWAGVTPGTGVGTALAVNVGSAGAFVTFNGAGGTPSSMTATNLSGTADGLTAGDVTRNHAIYAGASPPTVDVGQFTISKTGVDLKTAGTTTVFTVPSGRTFICTGAFAVVTAVTSGGAGTETFKIQTSTGTKAMTPATASASGTPLVGSYYATPPTSGGGLYTAAPAADNVQVVVATSQAGSTAVTGTVFVTGFYSG